MIEGMVDPEWGRPTLHAALMGLLSCKEARKFAHPYGQAWVTALYDIQDWRWLTWAYNKLRRQGYLQKEPLVAALCTAARATFRVFPTEEPVSYTDRRSIELILQAIELSEDWVRGELDAEGRGLLDSTAVLLSERHPTDSPMGNLCAAARSIGRLVLSGDYYRDEHMVGDAGWDLMRAQLPDYPYLRGRDGGDKRAFQWMVAMLRRELGGLLIEALERKCRVWLGLEVDPLVANPITLRMSKFSVWPQVVSL